MPRAPAGRAHLWETLQRPPRRTRVGARWSVAGCAGGQAAPRSTPDTDVGVTPSNFAFAVLKGTWVSTKANAFVLVWYDVRLESESSYSTNSTNVSGGVFAVGAADKQPSCSTTLAAIPNRSNQKGTVCVSGPANSQHQYTVNTQRRSALRGISDCPGSHVLLPALRTGAAGAGQPRLPGRAALPHPLATASRRGPPGPPATSPTRTAPRLRGPSRDLRGTRSGRTFPSRTLKAFAPGPLDRCAALSTAAARGPTVITHSPGVDQLAPRWPKSSKVDTKSVHQRTTASRSRGRFRRRVSSRVSPQLDVGIEGLDGRRILAPNIGGLHATHDLHVLLRHRPPSIPSGVTAGVVAGDERSRAPTAGSGGSPCSTILLARDGRRG